MYYLLGSILRFRLGRRVVIDAIARVLDAQHAHLERVCVFPHQGFRQHDVFAVGMEVQQHLLGLALDVQGWNEVLLVVVRHLLLELEDALQFIQVTFIILSFASD